MTVRRKSTIFDGDKQFKHCVYRGRFQSTNSCLLGEELLETGSLQKISKTDNKQLDSNKFDEEMIIIEM